jgi:hypothetical protein
MVRFSGPRKSKNHQGNFSGRSIPDPLAIESNGPRPAKTAAFAARGIENNPNDRLEIKEN